MQSSVQMSPRNIVITLPTEVIQHLARHDDEVEEQATLAHTCASLRSILLPRTSPIVSAYVTIRSLEFNNILLVLNQFGVENFSNGLKYAGHAEMACWFPPPPTYAATLPWEFPTETYAIVKLIVQNDRAVYNLARKYLTPGHESILAALKATVNIDSWTAAEDLFEFATEEQFMEAFTYACLFLNTNMAIEFLYLVDSDHWEDLTTPLIECAITTFNGPMVDLLIDGDADIHDKFQYSIDEANSTFPLSWLAKWGFGNYYGHAHFVSIWNRLISRRADVHTTDLDGRTVLHHLARHGAHRRRNRKNTSAFNPQMIPIGEAYKSMIRSVTECERNANNQWVGTDLNVQDCYGRTALHYAIEFHEPIMVQILLEKGADCNIVDEENFNAWEIESWNGDERCRFLAKDAYVKALEQQGLGSLTAERERRINKTAAEMWAEFSMELQGLEIEEV
jgi:ankyrin repeat protein